MKGHTNGNSIVENEGLFYMLHGDITYVEKLLEEHDSYREDFDDLKEEYISNRYDRFLVQLSWADLPYYPVDFFGGEEALIQRQMLDKQKKMH